MTVPIREEITLISKFKPRPRMERRLFDALQSVAAGRGETGNRPYILHRSREKPTARFCSALFGQIRRRGIFTFKPFLDFAAMSDETLIEPLEYNIWSEVSR